MRKNVLVDILEIELGALASDIRAFACREITFVLAAIPQFRTRSGNLLNHGSDSRSIGLEAGFAAIVVECSDRVAKTGRGSVLALV
jgi:hypothetical protein